MPSAGDLLRIFGAKLKESLTPNEYDRRMKSNDRYHITMGHRSTSRYLSPDEIKVLVAEGWTVQKIVPRRIDDYEQRLIKSMKAVGKPLAEKTRPKKWAGCLRMAPASFHTIVEIKRPRYDAFGNRIGTNMYLIPREQFYKKEDANA